MADENKTSYSFPVERITDDPSQFWEPEIDLQTYWAKGYRIDGNHLVGGQEVAVHAWIKEEAHTPTLTCECDPLIDRLYTNTPGQKPLTRVTHRPLDYRITPLPKGQRFPD